MVRPLPIHLPAPLAPGEVLVVTLGQRLELVHDRRLAHLIQWTAAAQASRERRQSPAQIEATHDLDDLLERVDGPHEETVRDVPSLEQAAVAGEHDAMLGGADGGQLGVVEMAVAQCVETDQAQEAGQLAQVDVDDEARIPQRRGSEAPDCGDVECFEHGIDGEAIAAARAV